MRRRIWQNDKPSTDTRALNRFVGHWACVTVKLWAPSPWSNCFWMLSWSVLFPLTRYRPSVVKPEKHTNDTASVKSSRQKLEHKRKYGIGRLQLGSTDASCLLYRKSRHEKKHSLFKTSDFIYCSTERQPVCFNQGLTEQSAVTLCQFFSSIWPMASSPTTETNSCVYICGVSGVNGLTWSTDVNQHLTIGHSWRSASVWKYHSQLSTNSWPEICTSEGEKGRVGVCGCVCLVKHAHLIKAIMCDLLQA